MCGRYVITNPVIKTEKLIKSAIQIEETQNYNAHPYQKLPVIKKYKNGKTLEKLQWGLVPGWAKEKNFKALINARLETIDEKVSFKKLIKDFRKKFDKPILKGAYIDESIYIGDDKIDVLADLKSKDELIGEILTLLSSPINNVLSSLKSGSNKIAGIIKKLTEK